ncbi:MAG: preprotein translocase subunit SecE [Gemmataceae bacterium]
MAVAVKTSPGVSTQGALANPAILSLLGMVYLLGCLGVVFKLIPDLWGSMWNNSNLSSSTFVGGTLMGLVCLLAGVGLLMLGNRLIGSEAPPGFRAGVFVAFLGLHLAIFLARWVSLWLEHWAYSGAMSLSMAQILTIFLGVGLILGWLILFFRPDVQKWIVRLEEAGWFSTNVYKGNQGQKVRRGTVAGLLMIVGAGIYTLISHNSLGRGAKDWGINIPFTGKMALESYGDTREFLAKLPAEDKSQVVIRWPGADSTAFRADEVVSFADYKAAVDKAVRDLPGAAEMLQGQDDPSAYLLAVNERILGGKMKEMLQSRLLGEGVRGRLDGRFGQTSWEDLGSIVSDFYREGQSLVRDGKDKSDLSAFRVPSAVLLVDRFAVRSINEKTGESANVKIQLKGDSKFQEGSIVSAEEFEQEKAALEEARSKGRDRELPTSVPLVPASGPVKYAGLTLLPSVQFVVPLLLLASSLWLCWRLVNMPAFADFLIATEAELNKVSWTTQKKLIQDTIVVLATVLLMSVFLFGMDWAWKAILSPLGVLHIPKQTSELNKPADLKKW